MQRYLLILAIALTIVIFDAKHSDACGQFKLQDLRSGNLIQWSDMRMRVRVKGVRKNSIALHVYTNSKKHGVTGVVTSYGIFAKLIEQPSKDTTLGYKKESLVLGDRVVGKWTVDSLTIGTSVFRFQHEASKDEDGMTEMGAGKATVSIGDKTIFEGRVMDFCPDYKGWKRSLASEHLEVIWKQISLYLAADQLLRVAKG